jgi:hypothetical protein
MLVPPPPEDFPAGSADCPIDVMFADLGSGRHAGVRATTHLYRPATAHIELSTVGTMNPNCLFTGAMQWANPSLSQLVTLPR